MQMRRLKYLFGALLIPLGDPSVWQDLAFRNIPKNTVTHQNQTMHIRVNRSASPLIYPLAHSMEVSKFKAVLKIDGQVKAVASRGEWEEDSVFRLGLVVKGTQHLNMLQKMVAPSWVVKLFSLAPPDAGIDRIVFFNVASQPELIGKVRIHPKSELMEERVVAAVASQSQNDLVLEHTLQKPLSVVAIWISIDGDDTKSDFQVDLKSLILE